MAWPGGECCGGRTWQCGANRSRRVHQHAVTSCTLRSCASFQDMSYYANWLQLQLGNGSHSTVVMLLDIAGRWAVSQRILVLLNRCLPAFLFRADCIEGCLSYAADLFESATMERMSQHLCNLLAAVTATPDAPLSQLDMFSAKERQLVLHGFNATATPYPADKPVHQLFEQHVASRPQALCLAAAAKELSYGAVNAMANQLAHWLVGHGVGAGSAVGVSSHKCPELYIALLAVLKAGGAYVPLDPELPAERAAYMVRQTGVRLLLTAAGNELAQLPGVEAVVIDQGWQQFANKSVLNLPQRASSADVAYCIFTSGSTGQPKVTDALCVACNPLYCWKIIAEVLATETSSNKRTSMLTTGRGGVPRRSGEPAALLPHLHSAHARRLHVLPDDALHLR